MNMKVSIVTPTFNSSKEIEDCLTSVNSQTCCDIEHIIVDGGSKDGTLDIVEKYRGNRISIVISEHDNGIYDAMNKGIKAVTGDIVGILNSDDIYGNEQVIENVVKVITVNNVDSCYSDLVYVDRQNIDKRIRYWKSGNFYKERFKKGWMPPHPTFFAKKSVYEQYGLLNLDFPLAADYELMLRFLYKYEISTAYIPIVLVKMRTGGTSQPWLYTAKAVIENYKAWKINGIHTNIFTFILKPLSKTLQFIHKEAYK